MQPWRKVWDVAKALIPTPALERLRDALELDDVRLIQGATCDPPALLQHHPDPCLGACLLGFCGLAGGLETVADTEEYFARMCFEIDQRLGEPAGVRWLLNWWDETPRAEAFCLLLAAVDQELRARRQIP